jgi:serine/threonine protein kinase/Flp pilus assembly protein TadD
VHIKCPECKSENPDDSKFCRECGAPLKASRNVSGTKTFQTPLKGISKETIIAGKYKIINKIGEGGMGVVYKAKDTRLDRMAALKFLPYELTKDLEAKKRFIQEAKAAAALNDPHICTIYEIDESEEQTFISMEYIDGQSLKNKLGSGPLDFNKAKDIALQVAEGLKEAHEKGIIHRDIKPANIMLTEKGQAKITDFGLAKLSWGVDLTKPSTVLGTAAYMSPEQARGEAVDHRTDIWSFGAMLYEMFSGRRPFRSSDERAVFYSILNEKPDPMRDIRPEIPEFIEQIVMKAMEKDPTHRYQQMDELLKDLKDNRSASAPPEEKRSIIVLPFENISPDPEQEYFSDGLTEEIITDLSHIHDLLVISRSSAMTFKGSKKKIKDIAGEVNVRYALEGSVRKAGNNLRISAQLIDAQTDHHLWAEKFSGTLDDIFDIQEKVSRAIAAALKMKLTPEENRKITENPIPDVYAYECFLKARHELWKWTPEGLNKALQYLQKGLEAAGENAVLLAGMGYVYFQYCNTGIQTDEETARKAEEYTERALALDPESPNGHIVLGLLKGWSGDPKAGIEHFKSALTMEPNNFDALVWLPCFYAFMGKKNWAMPYLERLMRVEPHHPMTHFTYAKVHNMDGQFGSALKHLRQSVTVFPDDHLLRWIFVQTLFYNRLNDKAIEVSSRLRKDAPDDVLAAVAWASALGIQGKGKEAVSILSEDTIESLARNDLGVSFFVGEAYAAAGEKKKAMDWLENAVAVGFKNYPFLNEHNPLLEDLRSTKRFQTLMKRLKKEWEIFEA